MDVTIVVATYGDPQWAKLAQRALASATPQAQTIAVHGESLHEARNAGLAWVASEWVVFLDADDELEPGYITHLAAGSADLRAPAVRYMRGTRLRPPYVPNVAGHVHDCSAECLPEGNWLVVGTAVRAQLVRDVGGWRDWPLYEDWDLWLRCWQAGATVEAIPAAVYRAHVRPDSRNRAPSMTVKNEIHEAIVTATLGARA